MFTPAPSFSLGPFLWSENFRDAFVEVCEHGLVLIETPKLSFEFARASAVKDVGNEPIYNCV